MQYYGQSFLVPPQLGSGSMFDLVVCLCLILTVRDDEGDGVEAEAVLILSAF